MKTTCLLFVISFFLTNQLSAQSCYWTKKSDFPGSPRHGTVVFVIGSNAYVGTGYDGNPYGTKNFWVWNQTANTWSQIADEPGSARAHAGYFTIGLKGYLVSGTNGNNLSDMWEYDSGGNVWSSKANFPGTIRGGEGIDGSIAIGTKGYFGFGKNYTGSLRFKDWWEWDQTTNTWTQKADLPVSNGRIHPSGFVIGTKAYVGTGCDINNNLFNDFWQWDQASNVWTPKATFGGSARVCATGFSIGTKGYFGLGYNTFQLKDFWEYDSQTDTWTRKDDYCGNGRSMCTGFSIGAKAYIGLGADSVTAGHTDLWEYTPLNPLPIELLSFQALCSNEEKHSTNYSISIKWITATEINNDFFTIERSNDASNFSPIATIKGAGTSISDKNYKYIDKLNTSDLSQTLYYRLKQTDFDGKFKYFNVVAAKCLDVIAKVMVFPNPTNGNFNIKVEDEQITEHLQINIVNLAGEKMHFTSNEFPEINSNETRVAAMQIHLDASPGVYFLQINNGLNAYTKKLIVE